MMPTPFILNDAVVIKQRIKPSPPIVLEQQVIPIPQPKKTSRIIKVDSLKSNNYPKFVANNTIIAMTKISILGCGWLGFPFGESPIKQWI
jgi:hypothetical protein